MLGSHGELKQRSANKEIQSPGSAFRPNRPGMNSPFAKSDLGGEESLEEPENTPTKQHHATSRNTIRNSPALSHREGSGRNDLGTRPNRLWYPLPCCELDSGRIRDAPQDSRPPEQGGCVVGADRVIMTAMVVPMHALEFFKLRQRHFGHVHDSCIPDDRFFPGLAGKRFLPPAARCCRRPITAGDTPATTPKRRIRDYARPRPSERAWSRVPDSPNPRLFRPKTMFPAARIGRLLGGLPPSKRFPLPPGIETQGYRIGDDWFSCLTAKNDTCVAFQPMRALNSTSISDFAATSCFLVSLSRRRFVVLKRRSLV